MMMWMDKFVRSRVLWDLVLLLFITLTASAKKCCDTECSQAISYGRTVSRYITREAGFLSYPASAIVAVLSKDNFVNGVEMWEAEIQGKRGYIRPAAINELTFKCQPADVHSEVDESHGNTQDTADTSNQASIPANQDEPTSNPSDNYPSVDVSSPPVETFTEVHLEATPTSVGHGVSKEVTPDSESHAGQEHSGVMAEDHLDAGGLDKEGEKQTSEKIGGEGLVVEESDEKKDGGGGGRKDEWEDEWKDELEEDEEEDGGGGSWKDEWEEDDDEEEEEEGGKYMDSGHPEYHESDQGSHMENKNVVESGQKEMEYTGVQEEAGQINPTTESAGAKEEDKTGEEKPSEQAWKVDNENIQNEGTLQEQGPEDEHVVKTQEEQEEEEKKEENNATGYHVEGQHVGSGGVWDSKEQESFGLPQQKDSVGEESEGLERSPESEPTEREKMSKGEEFGSEHNKDEGEDPVKPLDEMTSTVLEINTQENERIDGLERPHLWGEEGELKRENLEKDHFNKINLEQEHLEREQLEEKEHLESKRLDGESSEKEGLEEEQLMKEKVEHLRMEKERVEHLKREEPENEHLEREKHESEHLEKETEHLTVEEQERQERERQENERQERERQENEHQERERQENERQERERQENERQERERQENERQERERQENERRERERQENERRERERQENERRERERQENERQERERQENERHERERQENERRERERRENEHQEREQQENEHQEGERQENEHQERERRENEHQEGERRENERQEGERRENERQERERQENEHQERERRENEHKEGERQENEHQERERRENEHQEQKDERLEIEILKREREVKEYIENKRLEKEQRDREVLERLEREESGEKSLEQVPSEAETPLPHEESEAEQSTKDFQHGSEQTGGNDDHTGAFPNGEKEVDNRGSCDAFGCDHVKTSSYDCFHDYLPLPGSQTSSFAYVMEYVRVTIRGVAFQFLPEAWSTWICLNRPVLGMLVGCFMSLVLMFPFFSLCCCTMRSSSSKSRQLKEENALRLDAVTKMNEAVTAQKTLQMKVEELQGSVQVAEDNQRRLHVEKEGLAQDKRNLEVHNQTISQTLEQTQLMVEQYAHDTEQLKSQLNILQQQQAVVMADKAHALEENRSLSVALADLKVTVQGLEATKEQLEADRYTAQTCLDKVEVDYNQALKDLEASEATKKSLEEELSVAKSSLEQQAQVMGEQQAEMETLRRCLLEVTQDEKDQVDQGGEWGLAKEGGGEGSDGEEGQVNEGEKKEEEEEEEEEKVKEAADKKKAQLMRIEAMLNTTKLQVELQEAEQQRDSYLSSLQTTLSQLEHSSGENSQLKDRVSVLERELEESSDSRRKTEMKLAVITEYFQQKEMDLHSKLEVGEQARKKIETFVNEAEDKDRARAEERIQEKEQLDKLRQQMKDLELTYVSQVKNHEKRANEATAQLQRVEQELRQSIREVTLYKKRVAELEASTPSSSVIRPISHGSGYRSPSQQEARPPSAGARPPSAGPQPGGSGPNSFQNRPVSAPRLEPRTSSPAAITNRDTGMDDKGMASSENARDIMNMTQPVKTSRDIPARPASAVNMSYDETMSSRQNPQRSVVTPDPNFTPGAANGPMSGDLRRPPPPHSGYPQWSRPPYRGAPYRPGGFYPPPPPMYRGYYPPPRPAPPPFHPAAGAPPFPPPRGVAPPMPRPQQGTDDRGNQPGKSDAQPQYSQAGPSNQVLPQAVNKTAPPRPWVAGSYAPPHPQPSPYGSGVSRFPGGPPVGGPPMAQVQPQAGGSGNNQPPHPASNLDV